MRSLLELRARRLLALRRLKTMMATSAINAKGSPTPNPNPNQSGSGEDGPGDRGDGGEDASCCIAAISSARLAAPAAAPSLMGVKTHRDGLKIGGRRPSLACLDKKGMSTTRMSICSPPGRRAALPHPKKENALLPAAMARGESGRSPTGAGAGAATGTGSPGSCATISATAPSGT